MSKKPAFDPSAPFDAAEKPPFDPNQNFSVPSTPTGLPSINKPTEAQPSEMEKITDQALQATPGIGQIKTMGTKIPIKIPQSVPLIGGADLSTSPARTIVEGTAMGIGAATGPWVGIPGAGVGNVVGGKIMDIAEDPNTVIQAVKSVFGSGTPLGQQLIDTYQKDPNAAVQTAKDEFVKAGYRFSSGVVGQIFSSIIGKGLELGAKGLNALGEGFNFERPDVQLPGAKDTLEAQGLNPNPAQYTTSKVAQQMKALADRGILSGDKMKAISNKATTILDKNISDLTTEMAGGLTENIPSSDLAKMIVAPKQKLGEPLQKEISNQLYTNLSDVISGEKQTFYQPDPAQPIAMVPVEMRPGGNPVSLQGMKKVGDEMQKTTLGKLQSAFAENIQSALQGLREAPDTVDFETAHDIRSKLLYAVRNSNNDTLIGLANRASKAVDQSMEKAVLDSGKDYAYDMWRGADSFFRSGKETFNNDLTAKLLITQPGQATAIGRQFVRNGSLEMVQQLDKVAERVEELTTNPAYTKQLQTLAAKNSDVLSLIENGDFTKNGIMNMYRKGYLQELAGGATKLDVTSPTGYRLDFNSIRGQIDPKTDLDAAATFDHLFPGETGQQYRRALEAGDLAFQKNPQAFNHALYYINKFMVGLPIAAVGGGIGAATGFHHAAIAGMLGGEAIGLMAEGPIAAAILTNPEARSLWLRGAKMLQDANPKIAQTGVDWIIKAGKTVADKYLTSR